MVRLGRQMRAHVLAILLLSLLLAVPAQAQEWYEFYEQGLEAVGAERWDDATTLLGKAIGLRGEPGANVKTYGLQFIDYFPYTYRGMAQYKAGRYEQALQDQMQELLASCESTLRWPGSTRRTARRTPKRSRPIGRKIIVPLWTASRPSGPPPRCMQRRSSISP